MPLEALIFDVDGTLAETEELHRLCFNHAFAEAGLPWRWDAALYAALLDVTGGKERMAHFIERHGAQPRLDRAAIGQLHAAKTAHYAAAVTAGAVPLRHGVRRLLDACRDARLPVAIATTTTYENVVALLDASLGTGALSRFAVIAAGDCVAAKKPAPDIYREVLRRLGIPACAAIAIEDTPNGLRSAIGAGVRTVITRSLYGGEGGFGDAAMVLDHLGDPGIPCTVLQGPALSGGMLTLSALRRMAQRA
jgi:HAD superfamily hydrolase (TIGR01509 family)